MAYRTSTQLELREDHALAVDAVHAELNIAHDFGAEFLARTQMFEVVTRAKNKSQYLQHPALGRSLDEEAKAKIARSCPRGVDLQVAIGDGLSAAAVVAQVPTLLPLLEAGARERGWSWGQVFAIRYCRVGILNELGPLIEPRVAILLIGERPGLATAVSLSAYLAFRPRPGDTDAQRNLVSNIHAAACRPRSPPSASSRWPNKCAKCKPVAWPSRSDCPMEGNEHSLGVTLLVDRQALDSPRKDCASTACDSSVAVG